MFGRNRLSFRDRCERNLDRFFKLRIAPRYYISRSDLDVEIRRDADIFYAPARPTRIVGGTIRQLHVTTIYEVGCEVVRSNAATESTFTDYWTNLGKLEHKGTGLGSRTIQFINDHNFDGRRRVHRSRNVVAAAKHVIVEWLALHPFD